MLATEKDESLCVHFNYGAVAYNRFIFLFQMPNAIWKNGLGAVGIGMNCF